MGTWQCPKTVRLTAGAGDDPCYRYAVAEAGRLLGRLGIAVAAEQGAGAGWWLRLGEPGAALPDTTGLGLDGYAIRVEAGGAVLAAPSAKGVLNAVYELAERLGILFLLPGEAGEWLPMEGPGALSTGEVRRRPRFPWRGVFGGITTPPYQPEEWLRFHAKLRFNAVCAHADHADLCAQLGLRLEIGGHGMAELLPRDLLASKPELFRMFQPEDFGGKRIADSNFCPTNPETRRIVKENFRRQIDRLRGVYAVHAWADDLPAGGWCMCSRCRALTASDQSMLAMRLQAETIAAAGKPMRVPVIAYHDTMYPGQSIPPPPEGFLLFAPRERCYAHALDDPRCARNRWYYGALKAWQRTFAGIDEAHTFEYYFDQILFRGLYPFLPEVILRDMRAYERGGIQTHLSLQVGGAMVAPEYNLLLFAQAHWQPELTAAGFTASLAGRMAPAAPAPWRTYLRRRQAVFGKAMRLCGHPTDIYFDYRWLPESATEFARRMVTVYDQAATDLEAAANALSRAVRRGWPERLRSLAEGEAKRACFEAADLRVMARQQAGANALCGFHAGGGEPARQTALAELQACLDRARDALAAAAVAGLADQGYYGAFNRDWLCKETAAKLRLYEQG